jgi:hypothetical protein
MNTNSTIYSDRWDNLYRPDAAGWENKVNTDLF